MSEWISINEKLPPISKDCLLFIKQFRSDSGFFWDSHIITGFWSNEQMDNEEGFYVTNYFFEVIGDPANKLDGVCDYKFIGYGNKYIRITHYMLLPEPPETEG